MQTLGLKQVTFPSQVKSFRGYHLDRVYTRGLTISHQIVRSNPQASDHSILNAGFIIE